MPKVVAGLTAKKIENASQVTLYDGNGLEIRVTAKGSGRWVFAIHAQMVGGTLIAVSILL
jgi:hypothetical protein